MDDSDIRIGYESKPFKLVSQEQVSGYNTSVIIVISEDDFAECPECNNRLEPIHDSGSGDVLIFAEDEDGPIYVGKCQDHGSWMFKIEVEDEDEKILDDSQDPEPLKIEDCNRSKPDPVRGPSHPLSMKIDDFMYFNPTDWNQTREN